MFFIIEEEKEKVLDFSKGTAKVFYFNWDSLHARLNRH